MLFILVLLVVLALLAVATSCRPEMGANVQSALLDEPMDFPLLPDY